MAKQTPAIPTNNPGMMFFISFFVVAAINAVIFALGNALFPQHIVLGTMSLTPSWGIFLTAAALSLITILALPFFTLWEQRNQKLATPVEMIAIYFVINFVGLWLLTRQSDVFGMGVTSWLVVAILAFVLDMIQGLVMMQIEKMKAQFTFL